MRQRRRRRLNAVLIERKAADRKVRRCRFRLSPETGANRFHAHCDEIFLAFEGGIPRHRFVADDGACIAGMPGFVVDQAQTADISFQRNIKDCSRAQFFHACREHMVFLPLRAGPGMRGVAAGKNAGGQHGGYSHAGHDAAMAISFSISRIRTAHDGPTLRWQEAWTVMRNR